MLEYGPDAYVTLDKKGNMIHCLTNNPNLILIKGAGAIRQFEPGEMMMSQQPELMEAAIKVYSTVYDVQMSASVLTVNVENVNAIRLELTGGYEAILGNTDELHEKLTKLNILLQKYKNENNPKGTFNVSVPDYPVFSENNQ